MTGFLIFIHVIVSILLMVIILMQAGRGGGLTESFASAGDVLGAQTNTILTRGTTILTVIFLLTSLTLAYLSTKKEQSLMANKVAAPVTEEASIPEVVEEAAKEVEAAVEAAAKEAEVIVKEETKEVEAAAQEAVEELEPLLPVPNAAE